MVKLDLAELDRILDGMKWISERANLYIQVGYNIARIEIHRNR